MLTPTQISALVERIRTRSSCDQMCGLPEELAHAIDQLVPKDLPPEIRVEYGRFLVGDLPPVPLSAWTPFQLRAMAAYLERGAAP